MFIYVRGMSENGVVGRSICEKVEWGDIEVGSHGTLLL